MNERSFQHASLGLSDTAWSTPDPDAFQDMICTVDEESRFTYVNRSCYRLLGYQPEELIGRSFIDFVFGDDCARTRSIAREIMSGKSISHFENRYLHKNGNLVTLHWSATWNESLRSMHSVARDACEALQVTSVLSSEKEQARADYQQLYALLESIGDGFFAVDFDFRILYFNAQAEKMTGRKRQEVIGKSLLALYPQAQTSIAYEHYLSVIHTRKPATFEIRSVIFEDWFEVSAYPSEHGMSVFFRCITERKKVEDQVHRLSLVTRNMINSVIITDPQGYITWVNDAFTRITGYTFQEASGQIPGKLLQGPETSRNTVEYLRTQIRNRQPFECELLNYSKDGRPYWIELKGQPIFDDQGALVQFFAIQTDITEKIELQQLIIQQEIDRQKDLTQIVIQTQEKERTEIGRELHDNVNQILTTAKLYVENVAYFPDQAVYFSSRSTELIQRSINEIRFLSRQLLTPVINDIGLRASLEELLQQYQQVKTFTVAFVFRVCEEKLNKDVKLALYRVIQEQLNNIVKYAEAVHVTVHLEYLNGRLEVLVADDGLGFDFSLQTTGIGLKNIRSRVEAYRGRMEVQTAPAAGCRLQIFLPGETIV